MKTLRILFSLIALLALASFSQAGGHGHVNGRHFNGGYHGYGHNFGGYYGYGYNTFALPYAYGAYGYQATVTLTPSYNSAAQAQYLTELAAIRATLQTQTYVQPTQPQLLPAPTYAPPAQTYTVPGTNALPPQQTYQGGSTFQGGVYQGRATFQGGTSYQGQTFQGQGGYHRRRTATLDIHRTVAPRVLAPRVFIPRAVIVPPAVVVPPVRVIAPGVRVTVPHHH